jgi:hypothetical protein
MRIGHIVFGSHPFEPRKPDPAFEAEFEAAGRCGLIRHVVSMESLFEERNPARATRWISRLEPASEALYRGWMLSKPKYAELHNALREVGISLVNSPEQYAACHYLPESYPLIQGLTPKSVWFELSGTLNEAPLREALAAFGRAPVIVKDYVKSQKHYWDTACFIPDASDFTHAKQVVVTFLKLQGSDLNRGLVFREFFELEGAGKHGKSGMPLSREVRLFYLRGQRLLCADYWNAAIALPSEEELRPFDAMAKEIPSNCFSMDLAKRRNGPWIVMELGDGQVAGLPEGLDPAEFFAAVKSATN